MNRLFFFIPVVLLASGFAAAQSPNSGAVVAHTPAAAEPGVTSTETTVVAQFQKIEDAWSNAVNQRDQYALELVLSPTFLDISAQGDATTRNQQVVQVINGQDKSLSLTQKVITVRMLGDIAVVNGTYTLHHKVGAAEMDEKGVFTHVFQRVRNGWACTNSQRTLLRQENSKQKRQGPTDAPFHIPFLSKGEKGPQ